MAENPVIKKGKLNDAEFQKGDLLLDFYDILNDFYVKKNDKEKDSIEELKYKLIKLAIANAYDDATLMKAYKWIGAVKDKEIESSNAKIYSEQVLMEGEKDNFLGINGLLDFKCKDYDEWHCKMCFEIKNIYDSNKLAEEFTYGNAQKWVNMSVKYIYIYASLLDKMTEFSGRNPLAGILNYRTDFHVPLDSYVLKAVFCASVRDNINNIYKDRKLINGDFKPNYADKSGMLILSQWKNKGFEGDYKDNKVTVAWSKLKKYKDYKIVQDTIKNCIPCGICPLEWENKVWSAAKKI